jgi:hypothetical protein
MDPPCRTRLETDRTDSMMTTHLVAGWSGAHEDETPLCGADKYAEDVWSYRTENPEYVTCQKCLRALRKNQETQEHDGPR